MTALPERGRNQSDGDTVVPEASVAALPTTSPSIKNETVAPSMGVPSSVRVKRADSGSGPTHPLSNVNGAGGVSWSVDGMKTSSKAPLSHASPCGRGTPRPS